jgi:hypothetical protein
VIALRDQLALAAPVALRDQVRGSAVAGIADGTITITVVLGIAAPPGTWLLSGGAWSDAGVWEDTAVWEDS